MNFAFQAITLPPKDDLLKMDYVPTNELLPPEVRTKVRNKQLFLEQMDLEFGSLKMLTYLI